VAQQHDVRSVPFTLRRREEPADRRAYAEHGKEVPGHADGRHAHGTVRSDERVVAATLERLIAGDGAEGRARALEVDQMSYLDGAIGLGRPEIVLDPDESHRIVER
jgi:hypothetical protein